MSRRLVAVIVAVLVLGIGSVAMAQPDPNPEKQCKKGRTAGTASAHSADENQNGFVCVDPETGEVYDDKGQFAGDPDAFQNDINANGVVCYNATTGVVTDDDHTDPDVPFKCPPGFQAFPAAFFP